MGIDLSRYIETKYGNSFSLKQVLEDKNIMEALKDNYLPKILSSSPKVYLFNNAAVDISENTPLSIRYLFLNAKGKNISNQYASYIQIPFSMKGFLMRVTLPTNQKMPEYLNIDYLIDVSNIQYTIDTVYTMKEGEITTENLLLFKDINLEDYHHIEFDEIVTNFDKKRKEIMEDYF